MRLRPAQGPPDVLDDDELDVPLDEVSVLLVLEEELLVPEEVDVSVPLNVSVPLLELEDDVPVPVELSVVLEELLELDGDCVALVLDDGQPVSVGVWLALVLDDEVSVAVLLPVDESVPLVLDELLESLELDDDCAVLVVEEHEADWFVLVPSRVGGGHP